MKKLLLICMAIALISCANGDAMVRILEDGIEQAPGGNSKMSAEETRKVIEAQERFYRAVERKAAQLD